MRDKNTAVLSELSEIASRVIDDPRSTRVDRSTMQVVDVVIRVMVDQQSRIEKLESATRRCKMRHESATRDELVLQAVEAMNALDDAERFVVMSMYCWRCGSKSLQCSCDRGGGVNDSREEGSK